MSLPDVSIGIIVVLVLWSISKNWLISAASKLLSVLRAVRSFLFPECRRLLTLEEYQQQGEEETRKALEQLRQYCRSPEANAWKITCSVNDPKKFASFVDGASDHVSEEESRLHDLECLDLDDLTDDSGEDEYVVARRSLLSNSQNALRQRYYDDQENIAPSHSRLVHLDSSVRQRHTFEEHEDSDSSDSLVNGSAPLYDTSLSLKTHRR
ncbi:unnamed protein product [Gongylonema pulchrum]|uniref:Transmembrane protein n=1 Tax=Gongylonema pulchrum TaxID=637853 RepID=A0A183EKV7_9BILA|nr:unnamed protein product [Gongylonema pulchrum]